MDLKMYAKQKQLIELLWEYMELDPENNDRVVTGYGTKTKQGLVTCIESIMND